MKRVKWGTITLTAMLLAAILGAGAASALRPEPKAPVGREASQPVPDSIPSIAATHIDPDRPGQRWAVRVFASRTKWACAQLGHTDGEKFGRPDGKAIEEVGLPELGSCADLTTDSFFFWVNHLAGEAHAVVFGVVAPDVVSVTLTVDGAARQLELTQNSFLYPVAVDALSGAAVSVVRADGSIARTALRPLPTGGAG